MWKYFFRQTLSMEMLQTISHMLVLYSSIIVTLSPQHHSKYDISKRQIYVGSSRITFILYVHGL